MPRSISQQGFRLLRFTSCNMPLQTYTKATAVATMASLGPGRPKIRRASGSSHLQVILAAMTFVAATTAAYLAASHAQRAFVRMKARKMRTLEISPLNFALSPPAHHISPAIISKGFILPVAGNGTGKTRRVHSVSIAEGPQQGSLVAAWVGGSWEGKPDTTIYTASWPPNGAAWSEPHEIDVATAHRPERGPPTALWNPVLCNAPATPGSSQVLLLLYKVGRSYMDWQGMQSSSADGGHSWSRPAAMKFTGTRGIGPFHSCRLVQHNGSSHTLLTASASVESSSLSLHMEYSNDAGATWTRTRPIRFEGEIFDPALFLDRLGGIRLMAQQRARNQTVPMLAVMAVSDQTGMKWSLPVEVPLPSPNSPLDVTQLADGRVLAVYNHGIGMGIGRRSMINIALSYDDGATWRFLLTLDQSKNGAGEEFANPSVVQTSDGLVHVSYVHSHAKAEPSAMSGRENLRHVVIEPKLLDVKHWDALKAQGWPASHPGQARLMSSSMVDLRVDGTTGGTEGNVRLSAREKEPYEGVGPADMKSNSNTARKVLPQKGSIALITSSKGADRSRAVQARQGRKDKGAASRAAGAQTARLTKDIKVRDQETTDRLHAKASLAAAMAVDKLLRKELTAREGLEALDIIWEDDVTEIDNSKLCYTTEGCRR